VTIVKKGRTEIKKKSTGPKIPPGNIHKFKQAYVITTRTRTIIIIVIN